MSSFEFMKMVRQKSNAIEGEESGCIAIPYCILRPHPTISTQPYHYTTYYEKSRRLRAVMVQPSWYIPLIPFTFCARLPVVRLESEPTRGAAKGKGSRRQ